MNKTIIDRLDYYIAAEIQGQITDSNLSFWKSQCKNENYVPLYVSFNNVYCFLNPDATLEQSSELVDIVEKYHLIKNAPDITYAAFKVKGLEDDHGICNLLESTDHYDSEQPSRLEYIEVDGFRILIRHFSNHV